MIPGKDHYGQKESGFHRFSHHSHLTYRSQGSLQLDALINQWKYCVFSNRGGLSRRLCIHHLHLSHKAPYNAPCLPPSFFTRHGDIWLRTRTKKTETEHMFPPSKLHPCAIRFEKIRKSWRPMRTSEGWVDFTVLSSNFVCFSVFLINWTS